MGGSPCDNERELESYGGTEAEDMMLPYVEECSRLSPDTGPRTRGTVRRCVGGIVRGPLEDSCDPCGYCILFTPMLGMMRQGDYKVKASLGCIEGH